MIKKERGALTYLSQEINGLTRENVVGGMHVVERMDEKIEEKMTNKEKNSDQDLER